MSDQDPQATPKRQRGAQPGNRNAYKHGYYAARLFLDDPETLNEDTLRNMLGEIAMLKDMMYHTYRAAVRNEDFNDLYKALRMMTLASNTIVQLFKLHNGRLRHKYPPIDPRRYRELFTDEEEEENEFEQDDNPAPSPVQAVVDSDLTFDIPTLIEKYYHGDEDDLTGLAELEPFDLDADLVTLSPSEPSEGSKPSGGSGSHHPSSPHPSQSNPSNFAREVVALQPTEDAVAHTTRLLADLANPRAARLIGADRGHRSSVVHRLEHSNHEKNRNKSRRHA